MGSWESINFVKKKLKFAIFSVKNGQAIGFGTVWTRYPQFFGQTKEKAYLAPHFSLFTREKGPIKAGLLKFQSVTTSLNRSSTLEFFPIEEGVILYDIVYESKNRRK